MVKANVGFGSIVSYGIGSIAYGIKDNGFSTFLMIYFNQVLGLPAYLVGIALLIAMLFDAVSDHFTLLFLDHSMQLHPDRI